MSTRRYPAYKPSGVEWLGEVPSHWDIAPYKRLVDIQNGADHKNVEQDEGYPVIGSGGVFAHASEYLYDGEAVLLGRKGTIDKPLHVNGRFWTVDTMYWAKITPGTSGKFAYYEALTIPFSYYSTSTALPSMTKGALGAHLVAQPPSDEQYTIAAFLDRETAKIDALIAEQERLIALLREKRQAVISQAVTKGLDPTVPMKDSGVEWLGIVPEHWTISHIKRLCQKITDGAHISPETEDGVYDFISTRDLGDNEIVFDGCLKTSVASYEYLMRTGCQPHDGDILFSKDGTIGKTVLVAVDHPFVVASSLIIIRPDHQRVDKNYFNWLLRSGTVACQVEQFVRGAGLPRLSIQNLLRVIGTFPPFEEQISIAKYIHSESQRFSGLIEEANRLNILLRERRAALISAAVTGKIDVREAVQEAA